MSRNEEVTFTGMAHPTMPEDNGLFGPDSVTWRLRGNHPETGETFPVDDPHNLLWVHCGEVEAYLRVAQRAGIPLTDAEADAYVDEQRRADAPGSVAELEAYFTRMLPELRLTSEALTALAVWAIPPGPPRMAALKVVYPVLAALRACRAAMLAVPRRYRGTRLQRQHIGHARERMREDGDDRRAGRADRVGHVEPDDRLR